MNDPNMMLWMLVSFLNVSCTTSEQTGRLGRCFLTLIGTVSFFLSRVVLHKFHLIVYGIWLHDPPVVMDSVS